MSIEEKVDKRGAILDAAEKLFAELGFDGASTRLIAKEADVNMAMLNYYFGGKEGLFLAVFERRVSSFRIQLQNINNENISSWEKIEKWLTSFADRMICNNPFQKIIYRELTIAKRSSLNDSIIEMLMNNTYELKKIITDGIANGSFNDVDAEMLIATLFGTKVYIVNSSIIASKILNKDLTDEHVMTNEIKPRLINHLRKLLQVYLIK